MKIAAEHPDADNPLLLAVARTLERFGACVEIVVDGENLVRRIVPHTDREPHSHRGLPDPDAADGPVALVCAQGLPNLLHELVHVVLAERLDDDHGIDYQQIPFSLGRPEGRCVLFEELACSVLSCAYVSRPQLAADDIETPARARARVDAWFREQLEIQPVFYGDDNDLSGFLRRVHAVTTTHGAELSSVLGSAYRRTASALRSAGAPDDIARPPAEPTFFELWRRAGYADALSSQPPYATPSVRADEAAQ